MSNASYVRMSLKREQDLTTASTSQDYKLGECFVVTDETTDSLRAYIYARAHAALTQYQPYIVSFGATNGTEVVTAAPVTLAANINLVGVPQIAVANGSYAWIQIQGDATALVGAALAAGQFLELANAGTSLVDDGVAITANSAARLQVLTSGAGAGSVYLLNRYAQIA